ncbi:tyrosine-protein phosphatase [Mycetocola tolaasinivorans]|uniref:Tyrosine-protein phosphatase n=1 Tax=Mycetocola tolaasinivorans TaxID=76635 RepID=A0A3L7A845_9MICO|nr:tyrosine-protein phosphatase [Mycetocola tolaasinivorans]RLP76503.1 tyrosine-protein phosphatase [Mycetocola tolaasinivorans]
MTASTALPVPGTYNFRDLGGYPVPGGHTRTGVIYRSDGLHSLGDAGKEALRERGIHSVIDLRDDPEREIMPDDLDGLDVRELHHPVFEGSVDAAATPGLGLGDLYRAIVFRHTDVVSAVLTELSDAAVTPSIIHCTAGKDRTGVLSALVLLTVGVDREDVLDDYEATQDNLAGEWVEGMAAMARSQGIEVTPELQDIMSLSPRSVLAGVLDDLDASPGGLEGYLDSIGVTAEIRDRLRDHLVVRDAA